MQKSFRSLPGGGCYTRTRGGMGINPRPFPSAFVCGFWQGLSALGASPRKRLGKVPRSPHLIFHCFRLRNTGFPCISSISHVFQFRTKGNFRDGLGEISFCILPAQIIWDRLFINIFSFFKHAMQCRFKCRR